MLEWFNGKNTDIITLSTLIQGESYVPKGIQKRIIVIQTPHCSYFESAFFLLRNELPQATSDDAMLMEAQKIIAESDRSRKKQKRPTGAKLLAAVTLALIIGIFCGAATIGILWLFVG